MDPVSALGLASAVVAIVDFSWKLLTGAWDIHQSMEGITAENAHLEDVTGRLESLMQALTANVPVRTTAERNILHLAKECNQDAEALRALLLKMKVPGQKRSLWMSLDTNWKSILSKREVAQLKIRIQESRADIQVNILSMLMEDQSIIGLQLTKIEQDCDELKIDQPRHLNELKAELLKSLREHRNIIQQQLQDMQRSIDTVSIQHSILRHLTTDEIHSRRDHILGANPETCRWILELAASDAGQSYRQEIHEYFIRWLRTGKHVLHISGNPGSGKSTLMKHVAENSRTREELRAWAGNKQLIFAQFYSWTAGTEAQRTLSGMLQSLLFQILSQHPDLIEAVFPNHFHQLRTSPFQFDHDVEKFQSFNSKKLQEAFDLLLIRITKSNYKVFLLIDGLDEFEGGDLDHEDLAERLKSWTIGGDIKLLVSSRPWRPFLTTFTTHRTLHLHELNHADIKTYATNKLCQDREIRRIGVDSMMMTIEDVVEELASQAQGIFLWAHLVLDLVRQAIRQQYSVRLLMAKIREYPSDLDDLYDTLRKPIEKSPIDKKLSNRMLLLAAAAPRKYPLYALYFSWLPDDDTSGLLDPRFPLCTNCQPYSERELRERLQCVSERVNGLARGFLETVRPRSLAFGSRVEIRFCHRTARDYLITNAMRYAALEESWPGFHQSDPYGRIYLADLIYKRASGSPHYLQNQIHRDFEFETIRKYEEPIRPFAFKMFSQDHLLHRFSHHETAKFIFLRCAARCRLDSYVLHEVANYPPFEMTILLAESLYSALQGPYQRDQLALGLLRTCLARDIIVEADVRAGHHPVQRGTKLPVWIFALLFGLDDIVTNCSTSASGRERHEQYARLLGVCCLLNELAVKLHQKLSITVEVDLYCYKESEGRESLVDRIRRTFSAAKLLERVASSDSGIVDLSESEVKEERRSGDWVVDTTQIVLEEVRPRAIYQLCRTASWNLASTTVSIDGERLLEHEFELRDILDLE